MAGTDENHVNIPFIVHRYMFFCFVSAFERDAVTQRIVEELKRLYKTKILPLEQAYRYDYHAPFLTDAEFDGK
jgi:hypothetical protein